MKRLFLTGTGIILAACALTSLLIIVVIGASFSFTGSSGQRPARDLSVRPSAQEPERHKSAIKGPAANRQVVFATKIGICVQEPESSQKNQVSKKVSEELEKKAISMYQSLVLSGKVTIAKIDESVAVVKKTLKKIPNSMKANMVLLQFLEMKSKLLPVSNRQHEKINGDSVLQAAKVAVVLYSLDETPDRLRFRFAPYVYKAATVHSRNGDQKLCLASLEKAVEMGFTEIGNAKTDKAFENMRTNAEFVVAVGQLEKIASAKLKKKTRLALQNFKSFPFDFELESGDNKAISAGSFQGKLLLVDFWGTWCPPCIEELPILNAISIQNPSKKVAVLCLAFERSDDRKENIERIKSLFKTKAISLEFALIEKELTQQIPGFKAFPTKLLIDQNGNVRMQWTGPTSKSQIQTAIDLLLAEESD